MEFLTARRVLRLGFSIYIGLVGISAHARPSTGRIDQIRQVVDRLSPSSLFVFIDFVIDTSMPMPAAALQISAEKFQIKYNPVIFQPLSEAGQKFIVYHELGHIRLGHVKMPYPGAQAARELEFEADSFACILYKRLTPNGGIGEIESFFKLLRSKKDTIPPGPERVELCDYILHSNL